MGTTAAASPSTSSQRSTPVRVAKGFVAVYYRVVASVPSRLAELYGPNSQLDHGASWRASGPQAIAQLASRLPLASAGALATVASLVVQPTESGGYVVSVVGTFDKPAKPGAVFSQTFVLEKQSDSHDDHFFCRNDVFVDVDAAPLPGTQPPHVKGTDAQTETTPEVTPLEERESEPAPEPLAASDSAEQVRDNPSPEISSSIVTDEVQSTSIPDDVVNGEAPVETKIQPQQDVGSTDETVIPTERATAEDEEEPNEQPDTPLAANSAIPNGAVTDDAAKEVPVPVSPPTAKKTWASIVSSKEETAAAQREAGANGSALSAGKTVNDSTAPTPPSDQVENIPPPGDADASKTSAGGATQSHRPQIGVMPNGHRPNHLNRGMHHQRNFGPSAVVQLSALSQSQLEDPKTLTNELREEFSQYGFKPRHVEVKAQKGIAFVEYETSEGVRAAVSAWSSGPRADGVFAGIQLNVSEKRPFNKWRAGSMRGGRGGPRGGRRNRPASSPMS